MATEKYKLSSPYTYKAPSPPTEDEIYYQHLSDLKLETLGTKKDYGVAVYGVGRAGTIHMANLLPSQRINLLVDFVVVSSPTYSHEEILEQALTNKKAVFCEKPVAETIEKTKRLLELARKMNFPLFSAFNRRFDPSFMNLRNRVRAGKVGKVLTVKVCSKDSPLPSIDYLRISGGIFHDCAVHDIDQILYSLGELPVKVSCIATQNVPEIKEMDDFDTVAITMSFPSGAIGMIDLSRQCCFGYDQRLEVFGEKGMLKVENRSPIDTLEAFTNDSIKRAPIDYSFPSRHAVSYKRELYHFIDVLDRKAKLLVTPEINLAVSKIATAAEESARQGSVVQLTWTNEELID